MRLPYSSAGGLTGTLLSLYSPYDALRHKPVMAAIAQTQVISINVAKEPYMPAPAQYHFVTPQGQEICIRSMREDDTDYLIDLFAHLSPRSRYQRFHRWLDHPEPERVRQGAEQLTHIPAGQGLALLGFALIDGAAAPVAVARYIRLSDTMAEPALTIRDDFQGQGLGTYLFGKLIAAAQAEHLHQFIATIQPSNQGALRLVKQTSLPTSQTVDEGQIVITIQLQAVRHPVEVAA